MRRTLSLMVLGVMLAMGLYSAWQINLVTGVLKAYNEESANSDWETPEYHNVGDVYNDGAVEPEPSDYAEPTME